MSAMEVASLVWILLSFRYRKSGCARFSILTGKPDLDIHYDEINSRRRHTALCQWFHFIFWSLCEQHGANSSSIEPGLAESGQSVAFHKVRTIRRLLGLIAKMLERITYVFCFMGSTSLTSPEIQIGKEPGSGVHVSDLVLGSLEFRLWSGLTTGMPSDNGFARLSPSALSTWFTSQGKRRSFILDVQSRLEHPEKRIGISVYNTCTECFWLLSPRRAILHGFLSLQATRTVT